MHKESVEVVSVKDSRVTVRFNKKSMCDCCRYSSVCGKGQEKICIENTQQLPLKPGDNIEIEIEEKKTVIAALIMFLFPGVVFVSVLLALREWHQAGSFFIAIFAICIYYLLIKVILRKKAKYFNLKILRKL